MRSAGLSERRAIRSAGRPLVGLWILSVLVGCRGESAPSPRSPRAGTISEKEDATARWDCPDFQICIDDYLRLADDLPGDPRPRSAVALERQLKDIRDERTLPRPVEQCPEAAALRNDVEGALGFRPFLDGLRDNTLDIITVRRVDHPGRAYVEHELLLEDPWVGRFPALLLVPKAAGPHPAIVGLPGHSDSAWDFAERQFAPVLATAGYVVLALMTRGNASDTWEDFLTRRLLLAGSSTMAVRSYEALIGLKALQSRPEVDPTRVVLMGHSGGSVAAHLAVRLGGFAALVADLQSTYNGRMDPDLLLDEVHPDLYVLHACINDLGRIGKPALLEAYGYPRGPGAVLEFLRTVPPLR